MLCRRALAIKDSVSEIMVFQEDGKIEKSSTRGGLEMLLNEIAQEWREQPLEPLKYISYSDIVHI